MISISAKSSRAQSRIIALCITPSDEVQARRPVHLAFLVDVSGSMEGERLDSVKRTLHVLADALLPTDVITLVPFETRARVALSAVPLSEGSTVRGAINALAAVGGTNLQAALVAAGPALATSKAPDAVVVLTDGQINEGLSRPSELQALATLTLPDGVPITCLGYGPDHNQDLLQKLAVASRGAYTFVRESEMLPAVTGELLSSAASRVASDCYVTLPPGWTCLEMGAEARASKYKVGSLVAGKPQWVVLKAPQEGASDEGGAPVVHWKSAADGSLGSAAVVVAAPAAAAAEAAAAGGAAAAAAEEDVEVAQQCERAHAARALGEAAAMLAGDSARGAGGVRALIEALRDRPAMQAGDSARGAAGARALLEALRDRLAASVAATQPLILGLRAQVAAMLEELAAAAASRQQRFTTTVSMMLSGSTSAGMQRGVVGGGDPDSPMRYMYSSPRAQASGRAFARAFTPQAAQDPGHPDEQSEVDDTRSRVTWGPGVP